MPENTINTLVFTNKVYDVLKWVAQIFLPGLGTLYLTLGGLLNLPAVNKVTGTIIAVDTFLGFLLKKSSDNYEKSDEKFDGSLEVDKTKEEATVSIAVEGGVEDLKNNDEVLLKVGTETPSVEAKITPKPKKRAPRKRA